MSKSGGYNEEFLDRLSELRNTPRSDGISPAQLFCGQRQRTALPAFESAYNKVDVDTVATKRRLADKSVKEKRDGHFKDLAPLKVGTMVRVQNPLTGQWDSIGIIQEIRDGGRSYIVKMNEKCLLRNRKYLKCCASQYEVIESSIEDQTSSLRRSDRLAKKTSAGAHLVMWGIGTAVTSILVLIIIILCWQHRDSIQEEAWGLLRQLLSNLPARLNPKNTRTS